MIKEKHRIFGLDIMRIVCALLIYARHSVTMFSCTYGSRADKIIINFTSPIMTCFFMISGFTIFYQYQNKQITGKGLIEFYGKRLLAILPSYYLVHIAWLIFYRESVSDWIALTPIELAGIQSAYNSLFGILHNGGTWFVSCILFSYLFYPTLQELLKNISIKAKIILGILIYFLLVYSNYYIVRRFGLESNYANPVFRVLEFSYGAVLASILLTSRKEERNGGVKQALSVVVCIGILGCFIILLFSNLRAIAIIYFPIPIISVLLYLSLNVRNEKLESNRILNILGKISYQFFLSQLFLWKVSAIVLSILKNHSNIARIIVSLICCLVMSLFIYYLYDRPIQKLIMRKFRESKIPHFQ